MKKKLALINYNVQHFWPFIEKLQEAGFEVHWINSRPITSSQMRDKGALPSKVCDILEGPDSITEVDEAIRVLQEYEQVGLPTIHSIIFMDQNLRNSDYASAMLYLANGAVRIRDFLVRNRIEFVTSGRDTAVQMLTMLICKKIGIWWGCVTRIKLPKNYFGFSPTQQGDQLSPIREPSDNDYEYAREWLRKYREDGAIKPFARPKIRGLSGLMEKVPQYIDVVISHGEHRIRTGSDRRMPGSSVAHHTGRYVKELVNYIYYRLYQTFEQPCDEPFVLYGLHRQPESSIDVRGAFFDDQLTLIKQIVRSIPVTHKLYLKVHFSDVAGQSPWFYKALRKFPGLKLIDPDVDSRDLINRAAVVVTNSGAMGQEGGYLGRPVIAMSKMFWSDLPTVVYCGAPPELPGLVSRMIARPPQDNFDAVARSIARYIASSFPSDPNLGFIQSGFTSEELDTLCDAYRDLYRLVARQNQGSGQQ